MPGHANGDAMPAATGMPAALFNEVVLQCLQPNTRRSIALVHICEHMIQQQPGISCSKLHAVPKVHLYSLVGMVAVDEDYVEADMPETRQHLQ